MNKGITYHIITIVAIFTALGLGIFTGSMLNGEQLLVSQQSRLMHELGENLGIVAEENKELKNEIKQLSEESQLKNELLDYFFEDYVHAKLEGYHIAVIITGEVQVWKDIQPLLQRAGANIVSVTSVSNLDNVAVSTFNDSIANNIDDENIIAFVAQNLIHYILSGQYAGLIEQIENMGYINTEGQYSNIVDYVIMLGPNKNGLEYVKRVDIPMLNTVKQEDVPVLIIEQPSSEYSAISIFRDAGFSTIDHIDTIYGKISLLAIAKGIKGNYGVKESATALIPDLITLKSQD